MNVFVEWVLNEEDNPDASSCSCNGIRKGIVSEPDMIEDVFSIDKGVMGLSLLLSEASALPVGVRIDF